MNTAALRAQLTRHEGTRLAPYRDTAGKLTIGIGRNLDDVGISHEEAAMLLDNDIARTVRALAAVLPWYDTLDAIRQQVIVNMAFNLGVNGLLTFGKMLDALHRGQLQRAATEMRESHWATQVGARATELAAMMES